MQKGFATKRMESIVRIHRTRVEQPVARRAHNPKVVGSNPAPQPTDAALAVFVFGFDNKVLYGRGVEQLGSSSGS